jgi:hypothetical protein
MYWQLCHEQHQPEPCTARRIKTKIASFMRDFNDGTPKSLDELKTGYTKSAPASGD